MNVTRKTRIMATMVCQRAALIALPLMGALAQTSSVLAQIIPSSEGTSTVVNLVGVDAVGVDAVGVDAVRVNVVGGTVEISGGQLSKDNSNLFHSFEQFDLSAEQTANFITNANTQNVISSIRGGAASMIDGTLQVSGSNANLYLINPAGVLFGPNSKLNLSGGLTATTADRIDFAGGQFMVNARANYSNLGGTPTAFYFTQECPGAVVNLGELKVNPGQSILIIGGTVVNTGGLEASDGTVTIVAVAGENLVRISQGTQLLSLEVAAVAAGAGSTSSERSTSSNIEAASASIGELLTGGGLANATALLTDADGTVRLVSTGTVIPETGGSAIASGTLSTAGKTGGNINVLGHQIFLQKAMLNASGSSGGGQVQIGGGNRGNGSVVTADHTLVDSSSTILANALDKGDGGRVVLWSDDTSEFHGSISARGGPNGGDGGSAELFGGKRLTTSGSVDLSALQGDAGTVLLGSENILITDGAAPSSETASTTYLSSRYVEGLSHTANVVLEAANDFTIEDLSDNQLRFQKGRSITFNADSDRDLMGEFVMLDLDDQIEADSGNVSISGAGITAGQIMTGAAGTENGGNVTLTSSRGVIAGGVSTHTSFEGNRASEGNRAGDGGRLRIEATHGDITVQNLIKTGSYSDNNAGNGGDIELLASDNIRVGTLNAASVASKNSSGAGGQILLRAERGNAIVTGDIISESRAGKNDAQTGGSITIEAANDINVAGAINTSSAADHSNTDSAGSVSLTAGSGILARAIAAVSTGRTGRGSNGDIFLKGDRIDLRGGNESVAGRAIWFAPASPETDLNIGISLAAGSTLDISKTDLTAIAAADSINIGRADSTGSVSLFSEDIKTVNERFPVRILGGKTLVGPNTDNNWMIDGLNSGSVNGISFENIGNLQGGDRQDTFKFEANGDFADTIAGGPGIDTVDFSDSQLTDIGTTFFEIEQVISKSPSTDLKVPPVPKLPEGPVLSTGPGAPEQPEPVEAPGKENTAENLEPDSPIPSVSLTPTLESDPLRPSALAIATNRHSDSISTTTDLLHLAQNKTTEAEALAELFIQIESGIGRNFRNYLGLSEAHSQTETINSAQTRLQEVETVTGITPALIYAYFVPDARSPSAIVTGSDRPAQPDDQLEVMLVTKAGSPIRKRQWGITREQVDAVSQNMRQQVTSQFSTPRQYLEPAQQLYDWLIRPIEKELAAQGVESLGFVMDDGLRTLPIAALHDGDRYLAEAYSVGLLPSFSLTAFEKTGAERIDFADTEVLAMGASKFKDKPPLPAVSAEIGLITQKLWQGDAFLNEDFVLENLQNQLKQKKYGIVHLATHASFESGNLENSYIQMWDDKLSLTDVKELGLDRSNINLIILSACSTALGDRASEYGFAGFAITAGPPSALASLWSVSDEGTLGFMSQFYTALKQSPIRAEALRQAQISFIRGDVGVSDGLVYGPDKNDIATLPGLAQSGRWDFSHPFYWSAFTMIGNPW